MNIAIIFAGGMGKRMKSIDLPKQFLLVHGKPIIIHTLEAFDKHAEIDSIVIACHRDWITYLKDLVWRYRIEKVSRIVSGGRTAFESTNNALTAAEELVAEAGRTAGKDDSDKDIVLIHDGVRPLITPHEISLNIASVKAFGSAITCAKSTETFVLVDDEYHVCDVPDRAHSYTAKAPQSFYLNDIVDARKKAVDEGYTDIIDSCTLMRMYGYELHYIEGSNENIKITTPEDFYIFRALYEARENRQLDF